MKKKLQTNNNYTVYQISAKYGELANVTINNATISNMFTLFI